MLKRKPFHESIIPLIEGATGEALCWVIGPLLKTTAIPKNHDNIADAWRKRCALIGINDNGVLENLEKQKKNSSTTYRKPLVAPCPLTGTPNCPPRTSCAACCP